MELLRSPVCCFIRALPRLVYAPLSIVLSGQKCRHHVEIQFRVCGFKSGQVVAVFRLCMYFFLLFKLSVQELNLEHFLHLASPFDSLWESLLSFQVYFVKGGNHKYSTTLKQLGSTEGNQHECRTKVQR